MRKAKLPAALEAIPVASGTYECARGSRLGDGSVEARISPACTGGKVVQKGIAARVFEWANTLTAKGYKLNTAAYPARPTAAAGFSDFGRPMVVRHPDGSAVVASDAVMKQINSDGTVGAAKTDCDQNVTAGCEKLSKYDNHFAMDLEGYKSVPDLLWEAGQVFGIGAPRELGLYPESAALIAARDVGSLRRKTRAREEPVQRVTAALHELRRCNRPAVVAQN